LLKEWAWFERWDLFKDGLGVKAGICSKNGLGVKAGICSDVGIGLDTGTWENIFWEISQKLIIL
jgi:hypothetical protein